MYFVGYLGRYLLLYERRPRSSPSWGNSVNYSFFFFSIVKLSLSSPQTAFHIEISSSLRIFFVREIFGALIQRRIPEALISALLV